ncbi:MAG: sodium:proton antiporter NhaD [Rikenellaceae bacterium]
MSLTVLLIVVFLFGIALVAFEEKIGVNKSATALLMSVLMWVIISLFGVDVSSEIVSEQLGEVSETLFFVMGALVMVELVDVHGGFSVISSAIKTRSQRKLLWVVCFITFLLSAVLDNIATAVIMVALVRKFIDEQHIRWVFAGMIIIAANAGGSFSPVGDVTTILLWTGGNVTPEHQIVTLFLPALAFMIVPLVLTSQFYLKKDATFAPKELSSTTRSNFEVAKVHRVVLLALGVSTMALVPVFQNWSTLPPFMRILMGLAFMWIYTDLMYRSISKKTPKMEQFGVSKVLARIDMSTILFFLGVLMSVAAMKVAGALTQVGAGLESAIEEPLLISFVIGVMSSFVDNVALVAATQGMYPIAEVGTYVVNSEFWTFLAYCAVTGGSLLIIGSATGVTVMGMEKLTFGYYLKRFTLLAIVGYVAGAAVYLLF